MTRLGLTPLPTVQLLHSLPDGTSHVDWLLARDEQGEQALITFRLPRALSELKPGGAMEVVRLVDHRSVYLHYEGPVGAGRGEVRCIARGRYLPLDRDDGSMRLSLLWERDGPRETSLVLQRIAGECWRLSQCEDIPSLTPAPGCVGGDRDKDTTRF